MFISYLLFIFLLAIPYIYVYTCFYNLYTVLFSFSICIIIICLIFIHTCKCIYIMLSITFMYTLVYVLTIPYNIYCYVSLIIFLLVFF